MADFRILLVPFFCISLSVFVTASSSSINDDLSRPLIESSGDSLVIDAGGSLNLTCRDVVPVVWALNRRHIKYESYEESFEEGHMKPHVANLVMKHLNYSDVGYYFCVRNTTENKFKVDWSPRDENVSSIYIYVKDLVNLLAKETEQIIHYPMVNQTFTFPCKPTFPDVKVTLDKSQGHFNDTTYDAREGFFIKSPSVTEHDGMYTCKAKYLDHEDLTFPTITVRAHEETLDRPTVSVKNYWQKDLISEQREHMEYYDVDEGSTVVLVCSYYYNPVYHRVLTWNMPSPNTNETGNHFINRFTYTDSMRRVQNITNIALSDSGVYSCEVSSHNVRSKPTPIYINVLPTDYENVSLLFNHPNVNELGGNMNIRWQGMVRAYPEPIFIWRKDDKVLADTSRSDGDKRYKIDDNLQAGRVSLELSSPTLYDIGNYSLEAKIEEKDKIIAEDIALLSFTMPVPPTMPTIEILPKAANGISPVNEEITLVCKSQGYPKPTTKLEFKQCFQKENCTGYFTVSEDSEKERNELIEIYNPDETLTNRTSTWKGKALVQGFYRCSATNDNGLAESSEKEFLVTDGNQAILSLEVTVEGAAYKGDSVEVLVGDSIHFTCRGNNMRASRMLDWRLNDAPLNITGQPNKTLEQVDTDLSYVSVFKIGQVDMDMNNLKLKCYDSAHTTLMAEKSIRVKPMVAPAWKEKVEPMLLTRDKKEMENMTLSCPVVGAPTPKVEWYKDDRDLSETATEADKKHRVVEGSEIYFKYLMISDAGKYKCVASNRAGKISRETTVFVTDPDAVKNKRTIFIFVGIGGVLALSVIILSIVYGRKLYLDRKRAYSFRLENQRLFVEGDPDNLNPDLGLEEQAELLPYDTKYEVPRDSIIFDKLLGAGAFGRVYSATALNLIPGQPRTKVAVKMMKSRTDNAQLKALRSEVKIMIHIGRHVNIVNLLGACSKELATKGELLLLVEYCKYGNILDYMRRHRKDFINQITENDKIDPYITEARMRQCSGSGSRTRMSRGLKYAHLSFNQDSVAYVPGKDSSDGLSNHSVWVEPSSPTESAALNGSMTSEFNRERAFSGSSSHNENITSDMTIMTMESSNGGSDGYNGSISLGLNATPLTSVGLLSWAFQIAKGMEYLAFKKVLHGDLAARNILLTDDNVVKISDFGLAKDIYKNDNYTKKSKTPLPWKWLAPECFRDGVFSTQSDIWSYGVVLWEIFTLGQVPYPGIDFDEGFIEKLEKGVRLEQPKYSTYDLFRVMLHCWDSDPVNRPTFSQLEVLLGDMLGEAERQRYLDLNMPYQMENTTSTFLNSLQSPDYAAKIREKTPNRDEDGYEMPFSPSPCGAIAMPVLPSLQSPRLTPMQMQYQVDKVDTTSEPYLSMSSPKRIGSQSVFNFDPESVDAISKRDSKSHDQVDSVYSMGSPQEDNYLLMQKSSPSSTSPVSPTSTVSSCYNGFSNTTVPLRHKVLRSASQMDKHDSGLYSPTACMQSNPQYVMVDTFPKTDVNNYVSKGLRHDLSPNRQPDYVNYDSNSLPRNFTRQFAKDSFSNGEYANVVPNGHPRGRTLSETSSGLGSISEEGSPELKDKPEFLKSSFMESPIPEEPLPVCAV